MVRITEAIYKDGVLRPTERLDLREDERVRIIVEPLQEASEADRAAALERVLKGQAETSLRSNGPYPSRDELHDRR